MPLTFLSRRAASQRWADPLADRLQPLIRRAVSPPPVRNLLDGVWLGAPLHPALTDVPVGAWTTALVLDSGSALSGSESLGAAADRALAVGTIAAVPAAVTGLNDMRDLIGQSRRIAMVHALVNVLGLSLSAASLAYRHQGRRGLARALSSLGYLTSSSAAHLGGKLSFALGIRVNRTVGQSVPESFVPVLDEAELQGDGLGQVEGDGLGQVEVDGVPVLLARTRAGEVCALASTCTHLGGPLAEGSREGDTVTCPWHGSRFDLRTGAVVEGPAVFVQPRLEARVRNERIEVGVPDAAAAELPELANLQTPPNPA
jgi:nitrite reductase/ring-hydroxylating ferredoxin subunit